MESFNSMTLKEKEILIKEQALRRKNIKDYYSSSDRNVAHLYYLKYKKQNSKKHNNTPNNMFECDNTPDYDFNYIEQVSKQHIEDKPDNEFNYIEHIEDKPKYEYGITKDSCWSVFFNCDE